MGKRTELVVKSNHRFESQIASQSLLRRLNSGFCAKSTNADRVGRSAPVAGEKTMGKRHRRLLLLIMVVWPLKVKIVLYRR
jgi:hypothetical protein